MRARRSISGKIAKVVYTAKGPQVTEIDRQALLSRLLLFGGVVIESVNLGELPFLVKMFGADGFKLLLESGIIRIASNSTSVITDVKRDGKRQLPLLQFDEGIASFANHDQEIDKQLGSLLQVTGLSNSQRELLGSLIKEKLVLPSQTYGADLLKQVRLDLTKNLLLSKTLLKHQRPDLDLGLVELAVEDLGGMQRFETNLQSILGLNIEQEHELLCQVVQGTANINQRIANMAEYKAVPQFEESEAPLLFGKIYGVVSELSPVSEERAFLRVINVTSIPEVLVGGRIDVEKLLIVRDSKECFEFQEWLSTTDAIDDRKLEQLISGLRSRASSFISSKTGRGIRLGVNTGLGLIPGYGAVAALAEGLVDSFLLDELLPSSGVVTFINQSIPSVFKKA